MAKKMEGEEQGWDLNEEGREKECLVGFKKCVKGRRAFNGINTKPSPTIFLSLSLLKSQSSSIDLRFSILKF